MKKYYILAFTFLCLLMGQSIFGQSFNSDYEDEGGECTSESTFLDQSEDCFDIYVTIVESYYCNSGLNLGTYLYESLVPKDCGTGDSGDCHDPFSSAYPCHDDYIDTGDCNDYRSYAYPCYVDTGDCNDYRSYAYPCYVDTGDCTDSRSYAYPCENSACTKTCDSGYKLNESTCGCELLPPCFGTTVEGLMPDGSGDQSGLVEALKTMVNSFFKSSDLLETMRDIGILDSAELSKGFDNYLDGGDLMGKLSLGFVVNDYDNNPTTENFMKIFVEGALLFLPPPASVGYTALDTLYQKYFSDKSFADTLAKKMAEKSAELFDCDLGSGVYGMFH